MFIYQLLVTAYNNLISVFPQPLQWLLTVALLIGVAILFWHLITRNLLFIILLVIFLPFLIPLLWSVFMGLWDFILYLFGQSAAQTPR